MNQEEAEFIRLIKEAITTDNMQLIKEHISIFSEFCFNNKPYSIEDAKVSNVFIDEMINILNMNKLWNMDKSYSFIMFFSYDWARFTEEQKCKLIFTFEGIFSNMIDTTSLQVIIEIIAEYEANQNSFRILSQLRNNLNNERYRYLIAYGYQRLIENTTHSELVEEAFLLLHSMVEDPLENVRIEAMSAINILYKKQEFQCMIKSVLKSV